MIEICKDFVDGGLKGSCGSEEVVVQAAALEVAPKAFDGVEFRTVDREPDHKHVVFVFGEQLQGWLGAVIAGVVQHKNDPAVPMRVQQLPEEFVELRGVLARIDQIVNAARSIVQRAVNTALLIAAGRGDFTALASKCPGFGEGWVEMNFTLIKVEQFEAGCGIPRVFLRKARNSFFSWYSWGSRR